ncbi:MAG: LON peptidase substrate-binding domain-containing protein [candidate division WS1 bacterium]|jgi:Lon protease-like protein|nr:LON peptidase substrate-binding domain-containing protein [candidate division WS1 bacterium]
MPLNSVLFPGAPTTLYIHEERYKEMLEEVSDGDGYFGVALLRAGKEVGGPAIPHDYGTMAHIFEATRLPDGSTVVLAEGGPRFKVRAIVSAMPIVRAEVELVEDINGADSVQSSDAELAYTELEELIGLVLRTIGAEQVQPKVPRDPAALSWAIAANLQVRLSVQQQLLEMRSATSRLAAELPLLRREVRHYRLLAAAREKLDALGITDGDENAPFSRS